jgi:hypothetical protein
MLPARAELFPVNALVVIEEANCRENRETFRLSPVSSRLDFSHPYNQTKLGPSQFPVCPSLEAIFSQKYSLLDYLGEFC